MKIRKDKLLIIVLTISLIFIIALLIILFLPTNPPQACTEEAKLCLDGTAVGRTEPNCEFAPCPDVEENRIYCTEEQKQADVCIEIYQPVCGYSDPDKIKCLVYPCASTYSNSCFACIAEDVLYWVDGVCPK